MTGRKSANKQKKPSSKSLIPKPQHLAYFIEAWLPFLGGGQIHVQQLTKAFQKQGLEIHLFHPQNPRMITRLFWILISPLKAFWYHHTVKPFDLIHSFGFDSGLAGKITSILLGIPQIHTVLGSQLMDHHDTSLKGKLEKFLLTQIPYQAEITVARHFKKYPNKNSTIIHIPNGIDTDEFDSISSPKAKNPTIIFVGRPHPDKGLDILQKAFKQVKKVIPNIQLQLIQGEISGHDLIRAYKSSHVFTLPSRAEGQPITLLEAWASKLPVVVTDVGENPHMVKDGVNGYLIKSEDANALAKKLIYLLQHPQVATNVGQAGYSYVKTNLTWSKISRKTFQVYQNCYNNNH